MGHPDSFYHGEHSDRSPAFFLLPRSESMDLTNDPRFFSNNVITKRLVAFQTISVVSVLMVNLSIKQMFVLEKKDMNVHTVNGVIRYTGFALMTVVFLLDLFTVIVIISQLFMTYRLLTAGPTGFEIAKSYYLNPNIVTMRHMAVKGFLWSLPVFVASTGCMVLSSFSSPLEEGMAWPLVILILLCSLSLAWVINKHQSIFKERYAVARMHERPLLSAVHPSSVSQPGGVAQFFGLDV